MSAPLPPRPAHPHPPSREFEVRRGVNAYLTPALFCLWKCRLAKPEASAAWRPVTYGAHVVHVLLAYAPLTMLDDIRHLPPALQQRR